MKIITLALIIQFYIVIAVIYTESPKVHLSPSTSNLSCYTCSTIEDSKCRIINESFYYNNYKYSTYNTRLYGSECAAKEQFCAVLRLDAKIDQSLNADYKFWAIERKCADECVDGCFVMGERTKLSLCTTCCTTNYCNIGNTSHPIICCNLFFTFILIILSIVCN